MAAGEEEEQGGRTRSMYGGTTEVSAELLAALQDSDGEEDEGDEEDGVELSSTGLSDLLSVDST